MRTVPTRRVFISGLLGFLTSTILLLGKAWAQAPIELICHNTDEAFEKGRWGIVTR